MAVGNMTIKTEMAGMNKEIGINRRGGRTMRKLVSFLLLAATVLLTFSGCFWYDDREGYDRGRGGHDRHGDGDRGGHDDHR